MGVYFFDTSALVKKYISELGSDWVAARCNPKEGNTITISQAALVESIATFCRKTREQNLSQRITIDERERLIALFRQEARRRYNVVRVTASIYLEAGNLCRRHSLRAYDAIQLACSLTVRDKLAQLGIEAPTFVSADRELLLIAQAEGLPTVNPAQV